MPNFSNHGQRRAVLATVCVCLLASAASPAMAGDALTEFAKAEFACNAFAQPILQAGTPGIEATVATGDTPAARATACATMQAALRACRMAADAAVGLSPASPAAEALALMEARAFMLAHGMTPPCGP